MSGALQGGGKRADKEQTYGLTGEAGVWALTAQACRGDEGVHPGLCTEQRSSRGLGKAVWKRGSWS